ncbi:hypothetical protein Q3V94_12860 [Caloramator sp. CAR-1]|nr:hypothetical protein [Caloramator sp. CAR-1]MDO6355946.1 hypothetical protein [Caloramator sp. CAR-1]
MENINIEKYFEECAATSSIDIKRIVSRYCRLIFIDNPLKCLKSRLS